MNAVVLLSLICLWYLKITSLPKLITLTRGATRILPRGWGLENEKFLWRHFDDVF